MSRKNQWAVPGARVERALVLADDMANIIHSLRGRPRLSEQDRQLLQDDAELCEDALREYAARLKETDR